MNLEDIVLLAVIVLILGLAGFYVYKSRKNGVKCIGCPDASACSGRCENCDHKK